MLNRKKLFGTRPQSNEGAGSLRPPQAGQVDRVSKRKPFWSECSVQSIRGTDSRFQVKRQGVILDVGKLGARVRFRSKTKLPTQVTIDAPRLGLRRDAEIIWQDEFDAGMRFLAD